MTRMSELYYKMIHFIMQVSERTFITHITTKKVIVFAQLSKWFVYVYICNQILFRETRKTCAYPLFHHCNQNEIVIHYKR